MPFVLPNHSSTCGSNKSAEVLYVLYRALRQIVKRKTSNCTSSISFFSHLFAPTCFGLHSTIIRVHDVKNYNELQCVHPSEKQFFFNVLSNSKIIVKCVKKLESYVKMSRNTM